MEQSIDALITARDQLCARIVESRSLRFGRSVHGMEFNDEGSMIADEGEDGDDTPPIVFHLIYEDTKLNLTGRGFKLRKLIKKGNDITVGGICFLRHAYRHFLASRIVEVTDLNTGEVSENGIDFFRNHPLLTDSEYEYKSEEEKVFIHFRDEIIILTFVSATDGEIHNKEIDELVKFMAFNWPEPLSEKTLRTRIKMFAPDERAFLRALESLKYKKDHLRAFNRALHAVVDADRRLHINEQTLARFIKERLSLTDLS